MSEKLLLPSLPSPPHPHLSPSQLWIEFILPHCYLQAEKVFNQDLYFKKTVKYVGEPMSHLESIASTAVLPFDVPALRQVYFYFLSPSCRLLAKKFFFPRN